MVILRDCHARGSQGHSGKLIFRDCHASLAMTKGLRLGCQNEARRKIDKEGVTSCPLRKASMMLFRGEMSKRISFAFAVTEDNVYLTLSEKSST